MEAKDKSTLLKELERELDREIERLKKLQGREKGWNRTCKGKK